MQTPSLVKLQTFAIKSGPLHHNCCEMAAAVRYLQTCCDVNLAREITFVFHAVFHREGNETGRPTLFTTGRPFNTEILSEVKYHGWNEKYQRLNCQQRS